MHNFTFTLTGREDSARSREAPARDQEEQDGQKRHLRVSQSSTLSLNSVAHGDDALNHLFSSAALCPVSIPHEPLPLPYKVVAPELLSQFG